jgi:predicted hydrocarbon binding protein
MEMYIIELEKEGRKLSELLTQERLTEKEPLSVPAFGYNIIREDLLKDLLGKDTHDLLYWSGKRLARKYQLTSMEEIYDFFNEAGFGNLRIKSESKSEIQFELESQLIAERIKIYPECSFHLEAGFLAQQIEFQKGLLAEAYEHPHKKSAKILFTVKWDSKDKIER